MTPWGGGIALAQTAKAETTEKSETAAVQPMASIVVDVATGKVLSQERASERRYPASTTKLMTAYLVLAALRDSKLALDSPVIVTRRSAAEPPSKMGFKPGSVIRLDLAMRMMLVKSANDVAYAIGETVGGSMESFVEMMNDTAARLGMADTRFINANGLPGEGQYSSARDLAILGLAIRREFPAFADYFGTEAISTGSAIMNNGNKLLGRFDGADGMKTGYICASGFNLVSSATRDGRTLVAVVLGANGTIPRERYSAEILEAGFATDPATVDLRVDELPRASGDLVDISEYICSPEGRTARANERVEESGRDQTFGSPHMHDLERSPVVFRVSLGGAAGNEIAEPGISVIAAYGIPLPTPRPDYTPPTKADVSSEPGGPVPEEPQAPAATSEEAVDGEEAKVTAEGAGDSAGNSEATGPGVDRDGKTSRLSIRHDDALALRETTTAPVPRALERTPN
ncbi:serine hydrolase [Aurantimonas sp. A2-1-M11]